MKILIAKSKLVCIVFFTHGQKVFYEDIYKQYIPGTKKLKIKNISIECRKIKNESDFSKVTKIQKRRMDFFHMQEKI